MELTEDRMAWIIREDRQLVVQQEELIFALLVAGLRLIEFEVRTMKPLRLFELLLTRLSIKPLLRQMVKRWQ